MIYRFDRFELLEEAEQLRKNGALVHLAPQPFRVLLLLVSRAGTVVTREEIQQELWDLGTFVDFEQGINAVIRRIRFALNDDAETPRFLQTQPRRGYCFVAPVVRSMPEERASSLDGTHPPAAVLPDPPEGVSLPRRPRRVSRVGFALALTVVATTLFATRGPHRVPAYHAPLAKVVRVTISPVAFDNGGAEVDPRSLFAELRSRLTQLKPETVQVVAPGLPADVRVDTTLWKSPDGFSIDAHLTEVSSGKRVWSETFRRSGEAADLTIEVAIRVTRAVASLYVPAPRRGPVVRSRVSPEALALYREGLAIRNRPVPQLDFNRAVQLFEKAVTLEPRFAEAWSSLGDVWTERALVWKGKSRQSAIVQARIALDRAIKVDPRCAEALNDRGLLLMRFDRSYREAEAAFRNAIAMDPAYVDARFNLALLLAAMGRHEESVAEMRRAQFLDPASLVPSSWMAFLHLLGRRYDDASAEYRGSLRVLQQPGVAHWGMMFSGMAAGRWDDAASSLSALISEPVEIPGAASDRGAAFRKHLHRIEPHFPEMERAGLDPYKFACFYAQAGDPDRAFAALDRAAEMQSLEAMFMFVDPTLDPIRSDPRFVEYLHRFGLVR